MRRFLGAVAATGCLALLVGCGGSSKTTPSTTASRGVAAPAQTAASTTKTGGSGIGHGSGATRSPTTSPARISAFRQALAGFATCLRRNGVNLPSGPGGTFSLKGVNTKSSAYKKAVVACRSVLTAALRASAKTGKHEGQGRTGATTTPTRTLPHRPVVKLPPKLAQGFKHFTACMRENGITSFPEPEGESFNISHLHLDTKSAQYKAAEKKCEPSLQAALNNNTGG